MRRFVKVLPLVFAAGFAAAEAPVVPSTAAAAAAAPSGNCRVAYVRPGSPAEKAGIQLEDFIVRVDTRDIHGFEDLSAAVSAAGAETEIEFVRQGKNQAIRAALPPAGGDQPRLGISCAEAESTAPKTLKAEPAACPFAIEPGQKVHVEMKDGRQFDGKVVKCDSRLGLRSGIIYRTLDSEKINSVTPR